MLPDGVNCCNIVNIQNPDLNGVARELILKEYVGMAVDE
jgi:hypothetical protein